MLWLFVGPTGVYLLDFFCSGIQFYLLLSHYLCFVSFLYLDLYVLGYDALVGVLLLLQICFCFVMREISCCLCQTVIKLI